MAVLAVLALATAACGDGGATDAGPVPARPATTLAPGPGTGGPTTTLAAATSGSAAAGTSPTTPAPAATSTEVTVFLVRGETVVPVARTVPRVPRIGAEAVKAVLAGPTAAEARAGLGTAVPRATRFLELVIDGNGIAKVDLSRDFEAGGGSLSMTLRLAQVTCTVDQFPSVKGVRFALAGELVTVFSGDGIVLDKPVTCDSYRRVLAAGGDEASFVGIWPFATRADVAVYEGGSDRTFAEPVVTARAFATRYLGMDDPLDFGFRAAGPDRGEVPMGFRFGEGRTPVRNPQATFTVVLRQVGQGGATAWTVVEATSPNIVVGAPTAFAKVASPVGVAGRAHTFEGSVEVQVREQGMTAGQWLGRGVVTGGGDGLRPFAGDIAFRGPTKAAGAVVLVEVSPADGQGVLRAAAVPVRF